MSLEESIRSPLFPDYLKDFSGEMVKVESFMRKNVWAMKLSVRVDVITQL